MVLIKRFLLLLALLALPGIVLTACQDTDPDSGSMTIRVEVDGERLVYRYAQRISVGQFLEEIGIAMDEDDEVNPLIQTQIRDEMTITVTRVVQSRECEEQPLPYAREYLETQNLPAGEEEIAQTGENGTIQICYRITEKDGIETSRVEVSRITIKEPRNELIYKGSEPLDTLIPIEGILTYLHDGQAWIIEGNTVNSNPITDDGLLDGRVFELSADGKQLLYTRSTPDEDDPSFSNELWAILDTTANFPRAVQLIEDVRTAEWVPDQPPYTLSYSTITTTSDGENWRAYNDLYLVQLDPESGEMLPATIKEIVGINSLGSYAYWGRRFAWSPDGTRLAWANADSLGLVNLETGDFDTLLSFQEYAPLLERAAVWVPTLSWSAYGQLITTIHGAPYANEAPKDSIIFDMAVLDVETDLQIETFIPQIGIWSSPTYSPLVTGADGTPTYSIAYFKAKEPLNSPGSEYFLWVADRDGSNARQVFPPADQPGLRSPDPEDGIAWSPNARQIALIYQSNLWIIDLKSDQSYPITRDGRA
ncbi:MAG: G5 domain-containing protein, partial [Anaerolineae bacterium]|nr:G5 domain-containing protein [Anaerolineae bacterium]